jgi:isoleucyl-tRNA synthetase
MSHGGESVALDLTLTTDLIAAGQVREVVRALQEARKNEGFNISDRIHVRWNSRDNVVLAIEGALSYIANEVLALEFVRDAQLEVSATELGLTAILSKAP